MTCPGQRTRDAYRIWLSEIMLQQTQVSTVIPYYARFLERFPTVAALAVAPADEVMSLWAGLGYYTRARNLHRCAQVVVAEHGGGFPASAALLAELPGIGRSTAAAIAAFSFGQREAILDGNVKRVLARVFGIEGFPGEKKIENAMWVLAESLLPPAGDDGIDAYTQGLMDFGATLLHARPARLRALSVRGPLHCQRDGASTRAARGTAAQGDAGSPHLDAGHAARRAGLAATARADRYLGRSMEPARGRGHRDTRTFG